MNKSSERWIRRANRLKPLIIDESDDALLFGFYDLFPGLTRDIAQFPPVPAVRTERRRKALKHA